MKQIKKHTARKLYNEGKPFIIVACKLPPDCVLARRVHKSDFEHLTDIPFDRMVYGYEMSCCFAGVGSHAAFYVEEE